MALQLNLLHEEILQQRQRQRDPLKIGILMLMLAAGLLVIYYMWNAYRTLETKSRLAALDRDWAKVEPQVTAAQKRTEELNDVIKATHGLDKYIDNRFVWSAFLEKVAGCVAPNTQLTSLSGSVLDDNKGLDVTIEGLAAGREPRSVAEDLRQMLLEQLTRNSLGIQIPPGQHAEGSEKQDVVVDRVLPQSPAEEAGLQKGDIIRKMEGHDVKNFADLLAWVRQVELNKKFAMEITRDQKPLKVRAQISERQPEYTDVSVEFRSLEDVDQIVMVAGNHLAVAHYMLNVNLKPQVTQPGSTAGTDRNRKR